MARTIRELGDVVALLTGVRAPDVQNRIRVLRAGRLLPPGKVGRGGAGEAMPEHAASIILGLLVPGEAKDIATHVGALVGRRETTGTSYRTSDGREFPPSILCNSTSFVDQFADAAARVHRETLGESLAGLVSYATEAGELPFHNALMRAFLRVGQHGTAPVTATVFIEWGDNRPPYVRCFDEQDDGQDPIPRHARTVTQEVNLRLFLAIGRWLEGAEPYFYGPGPIVDIEDIAR